MKLSIISIAALIAIKSQVTESQEQSIDSGLRGGFTNQKIASILSTVKETSEESSCVKLVEEESCNTSKDDQGKKCVWCDCSAVPSSCFSEEQASRLPSSIFNCASSVSVEEEIPTTEDLEVEEEHNNLYTFNFEDGVTHTLSSDLVSPDLCDNSSLSRSGYMSVKGSKYDDNGKDNKHLFYWMFEKRTKSLIPSNEDEEESTSNEKDKTPFIIWLSGGPGCSSSMALLTENGPCTVDKNGSTTSKNIFSWTEVGDVLWLDQPADTGYSYGANNDIDEAMISEDAYYFLQAFFKTHPEYLKKPLYITAESYGGHYAPAIAHKIFMNNKDLKKGMLHLNLAGMAVGNGLTNPPEQYKWYHKMAYGENSHGIKVVGEATHEVMKEGLIGCELLAKSCNEGNGFANDAACRAGLIVCNLSQIVPYVITGHNVYDMRKMCEHPPLCYDFSHIQTFMNKKSTREALHVSKESGEWETCNFFVNFNFHGDWLKDFSGYVADLLNADIPVLIYAGDVDYICNYLGNRAWTLKLDWKSKDKFVSAEEHQWGTGTGSDGKYAGLARTADGFTFLQVYNAGHLVPHDKPSVALDMIRTFVTGESF